MDHLDLVTPSVVRVAGGRGFVVEGKAERLIITAAHCLPFFPPCMSFQISTSGRIRNCWR
jgi:hypothetical protein